MPKKTTKSSAKKADTRPTTRCDSLSTLIGKTIVYFEEGITQERVEEIRSKYPYPPYMDLVTPSEKDGFKILILV